MNGMYILNGKTPVKCDDLTEWSIQMSTMNRMVAKTVIGCAEVSTVFLAIDYSFGDGPPLLFETMIFGGEHDMYQDRYSTWEEALIGHDCACDMIR